MEKQFMADRRKALEEGFFSRQDQQKIEALRQKAKVQEDKKALAQATGIQDEKVLDHLMGCGVEAETLVAFSLVPLVAVAWADGSLDTREAEAILRSAKDMGIHEDSPAWEILRDWMIHQPDAKLIQTWKDYVFALKAEMKDIALMEIKENILGRARAVAEAAGGFLGLVHKISAAEQAVLDDLSQAF
ncbi:MAG: hypothetical protein H6510_10460 [Acidobacteria bacterium]|nr:hypothetical protein [Acidobacteriota bacterium]MCB9398231.1 hypothetical protein [Acidobacteriota bacterium]